MGKRGLLNYDAYFFGIHFLTAKSTNIFSAAKLADKCNFRFPSTFLFGVKMTHPLLRDEGGAHQGDRQSVYRDGEEDLGLEAAEAEHGPLLLRVHGWGWVPVLSTLFFTVF